MTTMAHHFSFPACRRIARFMGCSYIPKYTVGDVLSRDFIRALIEKKYPHYTNKSLEARKLFMNLSWIFYENGTLALEIAVCAMVPQDVPPTPVVIEPVVKTETDKV